MKLDNVMFALRGGKNVKLLYFMKNALMDMMPTFQKFSPYRLMEAIYRRDDRDEIIERASYCCKKSIVETSESQTLESIRRADVGSVYYYDLKAFMRSFPSFTKINFLPGDIDYIASEPSLVKTRPIYGDNGNNVILNFDRIRHNIFVNDHRSWDDKIDGIVFRGKVHHNPKRMKFFERYFGMAGIDIGDTNTKTAFPKWRVKRMPISEQLKYKFVLSLEGNDVASNLKWIMSSRSLAVMPDPEFESWFMEGRLIPDVHYLRVEKDYGDLMERLEWALTHPKEAQEIVDNANHWIAGFRDKSRERQITQLIVAKYLNLIEL